MNSRLPNASTRNTTESTTKPATDDATTSVVRRRRCSGVYTAKSANSLSANAVPDANLQSITAVVIGGTSLFGGIGTMLGTVFGVFIPAVLQNGFVIVGVNPFWQNIAVGAVLIGAVYLDQLRRRSQYQR